MLMLANLQTKKGPIYECKTLQTLHFLRYHHPHVFIICFYKLIVFKRLIVYVVMPSVKAPYNLRYVWMQVF